MFDLIFYNPTTNPMKHADELNENSKISQTWYTTGSRIEERLTEEQVDEPETEEQVSGPVAVGENNKNDNNAAEEEENMAMPVQSIFPKWTRHDLKTKLKTEEQTNRFLAEKALHCPLNFDLTELEKDLEKEEERQAVLTVLKNKNVKQQKAANKVKGSNHGKGFVSRAMDPEDTGVIYQKKPGRKRKCDELNELCDQETVRVQQPVKAGKTQLRKGKRRSSSTSDENELGLDYKYSEELKFTIW
jgi:hypothetical protein